MFVKLFFNGCQCESLPRSTIPSASRMNDEVDDRGGGDNK